MKTYYNTCMDETKLKSIGVAPLVGLLEELAKLFPIEEDAFNATAGVTAADTVALGKATLFMEKLGVETMVSMGVGVDDKNPVSAGECCPEGRNQGSRTLQRARERQS